MSNLDYVSIVAPIDIRVCGVDLTVLTLIRALATSNPERDPDDVIACGDITLDKLCRAGRTPKAHVFAAVARLEEFGLIPESRIR
ncbi:hypothetical protein [Actinoplanes sp. NPDC051494]|uniref:hypothetical protein n=1 Tax=Actinoplanes sp. NPDC051494 TaxID=3363907 RepID=UPI0037A47ADE